MTQILAFTSIVLAYFLTSAIWLLMKARKLIRKVLTQKDDELKGVIVRLPYSLEAELEEFVK